MTETVRAAATLPLARSAGCPFDPPEGLAQLTEQEPLSRIAYSDGTVGWLATSYALVRKVLADPRFSSRRELLRLPFPGGPSDPLPPASPGHLHGMDPPEHTRYRRLLTGRFSVRRMASLTARVEQIAVAHLDAMAAHRPPVDLVEAYAFPIPALTLCELLGVPLADHALFQRAARMMNSLDADPEEVFAANTAIETYVRELIIAKRSEPTDDLLSDLTTTDLTDDELVGIGTVLLGAGLDTTANMIALGVFALLCHPDQLATLRRNPDLTDGAVEELLRYLTISPTNLRTALEDVELDGHLIAAGDPITVSNHAANRDPRRFADPDTLDLTRRAIGHVSFGHGVHQCVGQQLARVEMRVAYRALLTRFPTMRLAVPAGDVPVITGTVYSVPALPVTWDEA